MYATTNGIIPETIDMVRRVNSLAELFAMQRELFMSVVEG
jgi:hypothetical protein